MVVLTSLSRESRDDVLPAKFPCGFGLFIGEGVREADFAKAFFEVDLAGEGDGLEMQFEVGDERVGGVSCDEGYTGAAGLSASLVEDFFAMDA